MDDDNEPTTSIADRYCFPSVEYELKRSVTFDLHELKRMCPENVFLGAGEMADMQSDPRSKFAMALCPNFEPQHGPKPARAFELKIFVFVGSSFFEDVSQERHDWPRKRILVVSGLIRSPNPDVPDFFRQLQPVTVRDRDVVVFRDPFIDDSWSDFVDSQGLITLEMVLKVTIPARKSLKTRRLLSECPGRRLEKDLNDLKDQGWCSLFRGSPFSQDATTDCIFATDRLPRVHQRVKHAEKQHGGQYVWYTHMFVVGQSSSVIRSMAEWKSLRNDQPCCSKDVEACAGKSPKHSEAQNIPTGSGEEVGGTAENQCLPRLDPIIGHLGLEESEVVLPTLQEPGTPPGEVMPANRSLWQRLDSGFSSMSWSESIVEVDHVEPGPPTDVDRSVSDAGTGLSLAQRLDSGVSSMSWSESTEEVDPLPESNDELDHADTEVPPIGMELCVLDEDESDEASSVMDGGTGFQQFVSVGFAPADAVEAFLIITYDPMRFEDYAGDAE